MPPEKTFRGSKHLLTRYLEDVGRLGLLPADNFCVLDKGYVFWGLEHTFPKTKIFAVPIQGFNNLNLQSFLYVLDSQ